MATLKYVLFAAILVMSMYSAQSIELLATDEPIEPTPQTGVILKAEKASASKPSTDLTITPEDEELIKVCAQKMIKSCEDVKQCRQVKCESGDASDYACLPKGNKFFAQKEKVCNGEYTVVNDTPKEEPEKVAPQVETKSFHPLYFVIGLLLVIGGSAYLYTKVAASKKREFLNKFFDQDLESKNWGKSTNYNDFGELDETNVSFSSNKSRAQYFQSPEFYLQE